MDSEDLGPAFYNLNMEAGLSCQEGLRDNKEQALLTGRTMNVRTLNVLLAPPGKGVFNLEVTDSQSRHHPGKAGLQEPDWTLGGAGSPPGKQPGDLGEKKFHSFCFSPGPYRGKTLGDRVSGRCAPERRVNRNFTLCLITHSSHPFRYYISSSHKAS